MTPREWADWALMEATIYPHQVPECLRPLHRRIAIAVEQASRQAVDREVCGRVEVLEAYLLAKAHEFRAVVAKEGLADDKHETDAPEVRLWNRVHGESSGDCDMPALSGRGGPSNSGAQEETP